MASVFRRTKRCPLPAGATIRDKTIRRPPKAKASGGIVTWRDSRGMRREGIPDGERVRVFEAVWEQDGRGRTAPASADGQCVLKLSGPWLISWHDHRGKRHSKSSKTTDKAAAERIVAKLEADAALRRDGVVDATLDAITQHSQRSVESHLRDYEAKLAAAGNTEDHVNRTVRFTRAIAEFAGFSTIGGITADGAHRYARGLLERRKAARTVQAHLSAIKGFTRWLTEHGKLPADPLASVRKPNPKTDRRLERRMLLPDEWGWLRSATLAERAERYRLAAEERVILYALAVQTGLRVGELRTLTRGQLFLDGTQPYVTCKAGSTKNRKDAKQYIQPELATELRRHISTKVPKALVFSIPVRGRPATMLRSDLAAARRAWLAAARHDPEERIRREQSDFLLAKNHEGQVLDFHALRHTCGAWLAIEGVPVKAIQAVMRHSNITMTMDVYGHLLPGAEADAIARLPNMLGASPEALQATGTTDATPEGAQRRAQQLGRERSTVGATQCDETADSPAEDGTPKRWPVMNLHDDSPLCATIYESVLGEDRIAFQGTGLPGTAR